MKDLEQFDDMIGISNINFFDLLKKVEFLIKEKKDNRVVISASTFTRIYDEILDILFQLFERDKDFISKLEKEKEFILGDRGFVGIGRLTIPKGKRDYEQKQTDIDQKSIRIIIENVFSKIKRFFITSMPLRYKFSVGSIDMDSVQEKHNKRSKKKS